MSLDAGRFTARRGRRGMTLVELLVAAAITAVVSAAAAALLSAASNASSLSRSARAINAAGFYAEGRIGAAIRQARAIGQAAPTGVSLWLADSNDDGKRQLSEVAVILHDSAANAIASIQTDSTATAASTTLVDDPTFQDVDKLEKMIRAFGSRSTQWAENVLDCEFVGYPDQSGARGVTASFTIGTGGDATDFSVAASLRVSAP